MFTDTAVRNAKPRDKFYKVSDSGGLYLLVKSTGKYWRMDYRFVGKRKTLAIGVYPSVSLVAARKKRDEARELLAKDIELPPVFRLPTGEQFYAISLSFC